AGNSFVSEMLDRLAKAFDSLSSNPDVKVIILRSEGERAFCGGASLKELSQIQTPEEGKHFFGGFALVLNAMRLCSKIIVGRVQGKAVGGGVGLISACDYVLATEAASVKLSELAICIAPLVIEPAVTRKIGVAGFSELTLTPHEWRNAYWARDKGLFAKVFDKIADLDKELEHYTSMLSNYNSEALKNVKSVLWRDTDHWEGLMEERAAMSGHLALLPETKDRLTKLLK
ncbi:MAG: enoyl-CoA hydratase/isomerase family protein, partial [Eudoraea sp.]|nr:enoyl-CoA hydratase/isomerase family protein [Eudoraea sp.]